ncbi:MAG TPA: AMP-binding protein [bacterium]
MDRPILREITLGALLDEAIAKNPDGDAVVYADRDVRWSYREFGALVDRVARGLMALGVRRGEKVAVWATNVPHWVVLQFATARIGAVLLTVNTNYRSAELSYLLRHSECENIFLIGGWRDIDYLATLHEVVPEIRQHERGRLAAPGFPHLKRAFFLGPEKHRGLYSMPELLALAAMTSHADYRARQAELSPHDVVNMQYTSGTTGFPKGVMLTHHNILNNGFWIGEHQRLTAADRVCIPVPLFHCFGCVLCVLAAVSHASTMIILETFDTLQVMVAIEKERATTLNGVPTMFISILDHPLFAKFDFSTLRSGIMAGSPCPVKTMREAIELMHLGEITICYGLTEASPVLTQTRVDDDLRRRTETVGRAMPGIEVRTVDPETGADCAPGAHGEVVCRGYNVMKGYYNQPEETARVIDADGWLHSGDLGTMDADGYLAITGRLKDMIIRGGENVYPREVEEFLLRIDGVLDVQVVGVASRKYGEEVGAFIRLKEGAALTAEDVRDACRGKISHYKIPKYVTFVEGYPMTASGKVQKYRLRDDARALWPEAMA